MTDDDDLDLARRLRTHYRDTATTAIPPTLHAEVHEMVMSADPRRRFRGGPLVVLAAAVLVAVLGTLLVVGERGPSSLPGDRQSLAPVGSLPSITTWLTSPSPSGPPSTALESLLREVDVLRGPAIGTATLAAVDESPFLIGGRLSVVLADCMIPKDFPTTPLLQPCGGGLVISGGGPLVADAVETGLTFGQGEVVLRVHTHDGRAADCPFRYQVQCERAIVVDQLLWPPRSGAASPMPTRISIFPPQLDPTGCRTLSFEPERCVAIVEVARELASAAWPKIEQVQIGPPGDEVSLGSTGLADVAFTLVDGTTVHRAVRCLVLRGHGSLVCGAPTVVPVTP